MPSALPPGRRRVSRCGCGWGCTRASRCSWVRDTSAWMCIGRRGSWLPATAGRCCSRRRPAYWSTGASLSDLGDHRLKDFDEPVRLFQIGTADFPPLKTLNNTNLPVPASSFVGRERELAEVTSLLRNGGGRLATLTGPGGSGKTRLALEAAGDVVGDYPDGVFWVGLANLREPGLVVETIEQTLGARSGLAERIGDRTLLLLLDNFEHVIDAAVELSVLLGACRNLRLLVTSRELLRLQGEVEYQVPPLAQDEAEDLFCARSRLPPDDEIADLCRRLDDLPLAVELAAARTAVLSPAQIGERLSQRLDLFRGGRDADPRQQTLRATIEWSYELLERTGAPAVHPSVGLRGRLHLRGRRADRGGRRRHTAVARRQEPRPEDRRALLDAGDDRRAGSRAPRGLGRGRRDRTPARRPLPRHGRAGRACPEGPRPAGLATTA